MGRGWRGGDGGMPHTRDSMPTYWPSPVSVASCWPNARAGSTEAKKMYSAGAAVLGARHGTHRRRSMHVSVMIQAARWPAGCPLLRFSFLQKEPPRPQRAFGACECTISPVLTWVSGRASNRLHTTPSAAADQRRPHYPGASCCQPSSCVQRCAVGCCVPRAASAGALAEWNAAAPAAVVGGTVAAA